MSVEQRLVLVTNQSNEILNRIGDRIANGLTALNDLEEIQRDKDMMAFLWKVVNLRCPVKVSKGKGKEAEDPWHAIRPLLTKTDNLLESQRAIVSGN